MALKDKVDLSGAEQAGRKLGMTDKIRSLVKERLRGNEKLGGRWQEVGSTIPVPSVRLIYGWGC
jgi:hypothetical protein